MLKFRRVGAAKVLLAVLIFVMAAFILLSFSKEKFDARALLFMALTMLLHSAKWGQIDGRACGLPYGNRPCYAI